MVEEDKRIAFEQIKFEDSTVQLAQSRERDNIQSKAHNYEANCKHDS